MRFLMLLMLVAASTAFAAPQRTELKFTVKSDSQSFMREVVRVCMSSPTSKVEPLGAQQLKLTESSDACAREIQSFASRWDSDPGLKTLAIHARAEEKSGLESRLRARFPDDLKVEAGQACPCVLLKGPKASEAVSFILR